MYLQFKRLNSRFLYKSIHIQMKNFMNIKNAEIFNVASLKTLKIFWSLLKRILKFNLRQFMGSRDLEDCHLKIDWISIWIWRGLIMIISLRLDLLLSTLKIFCDQKFFRSSNKFPNFYRIKLSISTTIIVNFHILKKSVANYIKQLSWLLSQKKN